ncbi:hypothetical protein [Paractinoplanes atraurantiacus]|nr:hypothetical protein [Actinoplanes atraurantiacus]
MTRTTSAVLITALIAAGVAGCDAGGRGRSAGPSASTSAAPQQLLALGQEWVRCMRDKGMTRMPDAQLTPEGYLQFPNQGGYEWKRDLAAHPGIIEACKSIEDRYPPNAFRPKQAVTAEDLRKLAEFAKCVRQHGLPAWPDPNAAGEFDLRGTSLANGISGRQSEALDKACKHIWSGDIKVHDNGGGKK